MPQRPLTKYLPGLEPLEHKQLLSAGPTTRALEHVASGSKELASHPADTSSTASAGVATPSKGQKVETPATPQKKPTTGFLMYRITNPNRYNKGLNPPFAQVLVQPNQPVAGHTYNILWVIARNGTAQTFNASSGFYVRFPTSNYTVPILTGNEEWKPGQRIVFYVLTQKYYPLPSQVHSGFEFNLAGARSVAIPGPSAIALRIKYNPATFNNTLDNIIVFGQGNQGGAGAIYGLPNTAISEFLFAATNRNDFAGYF